MSCAHEVLSESFRMRGGGRRQRGSQTARKGEDKTLDTHEPQRPGQCSPAAWQVFPDLFGARELTSLEAACDL